MEHFVLAREGQFIRMTSHSLGLVNLGSDLLSSGHTPFLEYGEGVQHKFVALSPPLPELSAGIVGGTTCDPVLLTLQIGIEDLGTV